MGLEISSPEKENVDLNKIKNFYKEIKKLSTKSDLEGVHNFVILKNSKIIAQGSLHPYSYESSHMLFSLSKSFCSIAIGIAQEEGYLSIEDSVGKYIKGDFPKSKTKYLDDLKIKHLLTMSTGHKEDTFGAMLKNSSDNWEKVIIEQEVIHNPGEVFLYNTGATYLLSAVLQYASDENLLEFLKPRLFEPLGIKNVKWDISGENIVTGGYGLWLDIISVAKFGQLLLNKGTWDGRQIISQNWIEKATKFQISTGTPSSGNDWEQGYGYQFWMCTHGAYRGDGAYGQFCVVIPQENMVVAITSGIGNMVELLKAIWNNLLSDNKSGPLRKTGSNKFSFTYPFPAGKRKTDLMDFTKPVTYNFVNGNDESANITFVESIEEPDIFMNVKIKTGDKEHNLKLSYKKWKLQKSGICNDDNEDYAVCASWSSDNKLTVLIKKILTPFTEKLIFIFSNDKLVFEKYEGPSFGELKCEKIIASKSKKQNYKTKLEN